MSGSKLTPADTVDTITVSANPRFEIMLKDGDQMVEAWKIKGKDGMFLVYVVEYEEVRLVPRDHLKVFWKP